MKEIENNSQDEIFTRLPKHTQFRGKNSSLEHGITSVLPQKLYRALSIYGIDLGQNEFRENDIKIGLRVNFCLGVKLVIAHLPLLFTLVMQFVGYTHTTFFISGVLDSTCYLGGLYLFLYRRKEIILSLKYFSAIPCNLNLSQNAKGCKLEKTTVLLGAALIYITIYLMYGTISYFLSIVESSSKDEDLQLKIMEFFMHIFYCIVVGFGIPIHVTLFVQFASLVSDRLLFINQILETSSKNEYLSAEKIGEQRQVFCKIQKLSSTSDSIFKELVFLWLLKIIIRGCLSAVDIFSRSWTNNESFTQIIVSFDATFDLVHLLVLCAKAGKIDYEKTKLLQTLIYMGSMHSVMGQIRNELHLFISVVGHSQIGFTVADIFVLNKSTALTILGALGSYCVLIFQFTKS